MKAQISWMSPIPFSEGEVEIREVDVEIRFEEDGFDIDGLATDRLHLGLGDFVGAMNEYYARYRG